MECQDTKANPTLEDWNADELLPEYEHPSGDTVLDMWT